MEIVKQSLSSDLSSKLNDLTGDSFFASPGFLSLWKSVNGTPVYWLAIDNENIVAALPGVEFGVKPLKRFQAMPDGCYASILFDPTLTEPQQDEIVLQLEKSLLSAGYTKLFIYDYLNQLSQFNQLEKNNWTTQLVDIASDNWQPPDKKIQSEIRKAKREEVELVRFDANLHFDKFISLMEQTEQRHNRSPKYPAQFYQALSQLALEDSRVVWHWCEYENQPVASHINFVLGDTILNWQVFFDKQFSFLKANQFILYQTARSFKNSGGKYLNLGASPDDAVELKKYKSKYGSYDYQYSYYSNKNIIGKLF